MYIIKQLLFEEGEQQQQQQEQQQSQAQTPQQQPSMVPPTILSSTSAKPAAAAPVVQTSSPTPKAMTKTMSTELSGFPRLQPAIITKVNIGDVNALGIIHSGSTLTHFGTPTGSIESAPGYEPAFKAEVVWGADWLSFDPDGQHARINLKGIARTTEGQSIDFRYKGVIKLSPGLNKIFTMSPDMETVPFGNATGYHTFLVADPKLKDLENSVFVSNSRILVHEKGLTVETRQSKVIASTVMD